MENRKLKVEKGKASLMDKGKLKIEKVVENRKLKVKNWELGTKRFTK